MLHNKLFNSISSKIPYHIPYGGFGTVLNKASLEQLSQPIYCDDSSPNHEAICSQIKRNNIGEATIFSNGMTIFQLFYLYSSLESFCFHSDWVLGYILEFYVNAISDDLGTRKDTRDSNLVSVEKYPFCGNITVDTRTIRPCTVESKTCHNQDPQDMEVLSLSTFAKSQSSYDALPKLSSTNMDVALGVIKDIKVRFCSRLSFAVFFLLFSMLS